MTLSLVEKRDEKAKERKKAKNNLSEEVKT